MQLPKLRFTSEALFSLAANHGEKVLAAIAILCSLPLAWGGLNALRTRMLSNEQAPRSLVEAATTASRQFTRELGDEQRAELAKRLRGPQIDAVAEIEKWRNDEVSPPPAGLGLNRPLLGDVRKRDAPTVYPLEQVRAIAGLAVIARREEERALGGIPGRNPGVPEEMEQQGPQVQSPPAILLPYVVLTGLIPARKQAQEYRSRYGEASYRDPQRDVPRWSDFTVERQTLDASEDDPWKKVDLRQAVKRWGQSWSGVAAETLPAELILSDTENPRDPATMPIGFFGPLPQLAERPSLIGLAGQMAPAGPQGGVTWGLTGLHPWVIGELETLRQQQQKEAQEQQQGGLPGLPFADSGMLPGSGMGSGFGGFPGDPGMEPSFDDPMAGPDGMINRTEYRLFRFLDTDVEPGETYRYRVTIRLWNPNVSLPVRYLEDPSQAGIVTLAADPAEAGPAASGGLVRVPSRSRVVTRMLAASDKKLFGLGGNDNEALVLDANPDSGNLELHSTEIQRGRLIGIEKESQRLRIGNWRISVPKHDVETDVTVLDLVGEQEVAEKKRISRGFVPPPPFELLLVNAAGGLEHVTPIESFKPVRDYLPTLPGYMPPQPPQPQELGF